VLPFRTDNPAHIGSAFAERGLLPQPNETEAFGCPLETKAAYPDKQERRAEGGKGGKKADKKAARKGSSKKK